MNPLGDENGILVAFGLSAVVVLTASIAVRERRFAILRSMGLGILGAGVIYMLLALIALIFHGTAGYPFLIWLLAIGAGLVPAALVGLVQGLVASVIVRLMA